MKIWVLAALSVAQAAAQTAVTVVGPGTVPASFNGVPISNAFQNPVWLASQPSGALYITSNVQAHLIDGMLLNLPAAGSLTARTNVPSANEITTDLAGNLYSHSRLRNCISRNLTVYAGVCHTGFGDPPLLSTGDGGPAIRAQLADPSAIAADGKGNLYIWEDFTSRIRRVGPDGIIATVVQMPLSFTVKHMAIGPDDQLYASGYTTSVVGASSIYRLAGNQLTRVVTMPEDAQSDDFAIDSEGNFYTSDCSICDNPTVVRINRQGQRTRILTSNTFRGEITALAFDRAGSLFIATGLKDRKGNGFSSSGESRIWKAAGVGKALPSCTYSVTPAALTAPAAGGVLTVAVNTDASCAWTAQPGAQSASELTIAPFGAPFLSGPAALTVTVRQNTGPARDLELVIGGRTFPIRQAASGNEPGIPQPPGPVPPAAQPGCTFTLSPTRLSLVSDAASSGTVRVTTQPDCRWAITISMPWITLTGEATRQGDGVVNFSVASNPGTLVRAGVITIGNLTFAVVQNTQSTAARPLLRGVVNGASFGNLISANSFVSVVGSGLSASTATWDSEVRGGVFPKELIGAQIRVNGLDTYPVYVSPTQINFLTPPNLFTGTIPVEVRFGASGPTIFIAEYRSAAPGMFSITTSSGKRYPVAYFANTGTLVAPVGAFPGAESRPARPGDIITLYGTGLGPTVTAPPLGRALTVPLAVTDLDQYGVEIGASQIAQLDYVGMIYAGLYQINLTIPAGVTAGEFDFALRYGSASTLADGLKLALEGQPQ